MRGLFSGVPPTVDTMLFQSSASNTYFTLPNSFSIGGAQTALIGAQRGANPIGHSQSWVCLKELLQKNEAISKSKYHFETLLFCYTAILEFEFRFKLGMLGGRAN